MTPKAATRPMFKVQQLLKCDLMSPLRLINVNGALTLHSHGVVSQFLVQVVGSSSPRFTCWQGHLDTGCFGTLCLAPVDAIKKEANTFKKWLQKDVAKCVEKSNREPTSFILFNTRSKSDRKL